MSKCFSRDKEVGSQDGGQFVYEMQMLRVSLRTAPDVPGPRRLSVAAQPVRRTMAVWCSSRGGGESAWAVVRPEKYIWRHECGHGVASAAAQRKASPSSWEASAGVRESWPRRVGASPGILCLP